MRDAPDDRCRRSRLLRLALDDAAPVRLDAADWDGLLGEARATLLVPLIEAAVRRQEHSVPPSVAQQLRALALRHRAWHRVRTDALIEILESLARQSIPAVVLKGAALAWMVYPAPHLRPMMDLDVLVPRQAAKDAQAALRALGFQAERDMRRFGRNAHHLPVASRTDNGLMVNVEIHLNALSRDARASIALDDLSDPPRPFAIEGAHGHALAHIDMLRHLAHHLLEPSSDGRVRLIGVVDLLRYAQRFDDEIDWARLIAAFPFVTNVLACLDHLVPLPGQLQRFAPPVGSVAPDGVGETVRPLRTIVATRSPGGAAVELLHPPAWWMHAYYGVPPHESLRTTRLVLHPCRLAQWLTLRAIGM